MLALCLALFLTLASAGIGDEICSASPPWSVDLANHPSLTADQFAALLRCPEDAYCCTGSYWHSDDHAHTCSCDQDCASFGDCCWEVQMTDWRDDDSFKPRSTCVSSTDSSFTDNQKVTGCNSSWPEDDVYDACENAEDYSEPFYFIPATSLGGVTYYNGYCALCNYDIDGVTFWSAALTDSSIEVYPPVSSNHDADVQDRGCYDEGMYVSSCNDTANEEWVAKCVTFFAPVKELTSNGSRLFKNVYCALCNAVELSNLACAQIEVSHVTTVPPDLRPYGPNIVQLLRPVTTRPDCLCWHRDKCYILFRDYRFKVDPKDPYSNVTESHEGTSAPYNVQNYLTIVCISLSLVCLVLKVFVYATYKDSRSFSTKCTLCLAVTLFWSQLLFLLSSALPLPEVVCAISAVLLHYGFLATFFWTSVLSCDIWKSIATGRAPRRDHGRVFAKYCLVAWCSPLVLVLTCVAIEWTAPLSSLAPRYGQGSCWISSTGAQAVFFLTPMALLITLNVSLYVHIVVHIRQTVSRAACFEFRSRRQRSRMLLFVKLAFIMGAAWFLGFFSAFFESDVADCIVIVLIGLQGVYLFFGFRDYRHLSVRFGSYKTTQRIRCASIRATRF